MKQPRSSPSFTVLELCVYLALLAACALLFFRIPENAARNLLRSEVTLLRSAIYHAHHLASAHGKKTCITFHDIERFYTRPTIGSSDQKHFLNRNVAFGVHQTVFGPPASPTALISDFCTFPHHTIICYPTGGISCGSIYFHTPNSSHIMALTASVDSIATLRMYEWRNGTWKFLE